jgi:hypothetical protein
LKLQAFAKLGVAGIGDTLRRNICSVVSPGRLMVVFEALPAGEGHDLACGERRMGIYNMPATLISSTLRTLPPTWRGRQLVQRQSAGSQR